MTAETHFIFVTSRNVLIVSASAGTGHTRAAEAVGTAVSAAGLQPTHVDILDLAPRWVRTLYGTGFEALVSHAPRVWGELYRFSDGADADQARWAAAARRSVFYAFQRLLTANHWDQVVCTHFLPAQLSAGRLRSTPPFTLVITDFTLHRYWVQPRVSRYCVASPELACQLGARLPHARISVTGIPIDRRFSIDRDETAARRELGWSEAAQIAVVMGGGVGIGVEAAVRACLQSAPAGVQIVAVCGRNTDALARLRALPASSDRLTCLGYVTEIEKVMLAADVIVTKPGGLTCSEALALGKPLILTRPIPGHEEGNVRFLTRAGAAAEGCTSAKLAEALSHMFRDGTMRARISDLARTLGRPNAAEVIASLAAFDSVNEVAA